MERRLRKSVGKCSGISHTDVLRSYVGLLSVGKSDHEAITNKVRDEYFKRSLEIEVSWRGLYSQMLGLGKHEEPN